MFDTLFLGAGIVVGAAGVAALVLGAAVVPLADRERARRHPPTRSATTTASARPAAPRGATATRGPAARDQVVARGDRAA